jgi:predicted Zn-dependent protease
MNHSIVNTICFIFICFPFFTLSQEVNFDQFKTTRAVGEPPYLFKKTFQERVDLRKDKATEISEEYKDEFTKSSLYSLSNLLKSGFVLFGDPMTEFIQKVGDRLLKDKPDLKKEVKFFVIKNNLTNALCTDPGIIFVTTGLLAQIENEAQLAFIMSHEIVHYQEHHNQKSYNKTLKNGLDQSTTYEDLVKVFKVHEYEADAKALKLYYAAGYSKKEIIPVFDVLMYSYLTFDEINIDSTFFGNPDIHVPNSYFPEKANPILALEDYDDSKSSHPNIRKRKQAIIDELPKYTDWKNNINYINQDEFEIIQNIARFETVRENVILANYVEALYEIYILEKKFPNSEYLETSKAMVWSLMNQVSLSGKKYTFLRDSKDKEGAISLLYGFFIELSKKELALLAVRKVEDAFKKFPKSEILKELRRETIRNLAHVRRLEINRLESISYRKALVLNEKRDSTLIEKDSIDLENETKYDRIRRIREEQSSSQSTTELVDENFEQFLLYDLANNRDFNKLYEEEKEKIQKEEERKIEDYRKAEKVKFKGDIILLTPLLEANNKNDKLDIDATLKFYNLMEKSIEDKAPSERLYDKGVVFSNKFTTEIFNDASLIKYYLIQLYNKQNNKFNTVNFDYDQMNSFIDNYNNPYLLIITGEAGKQGILNKLSGEATYINLTTGRVTISRRYKVSSKIGKGSVGGLVYEAFSKFK